MIIGNEEVTTIEGGYLDVGLYDTIEDLFVNFVGALVFSTIGFIYIKNRGKFKFAENFILRKKTPEEIEATKKEEEKYRRLKEKRRRRKKKEKET